MKNATTIRAMGTNTLGGARAMGWLPTRLCWLQLFGKQTSNTATSTALTPPPSSGRKWPLPAPSASHQ